MLLISYTGASILSLCLAYLIRYDFEIPADTLSILHLTISWLIPLKILIFSIMGQFSGFLAYYRLPDLYITGVASIASTFILFSVWFFTGGAGAPPRSVIFADLILSFFFIAGFRTTLRVVRERYFKNNHSELSKKVKRVAIIGAGDAGATVAADFINKRGLYMRPVLFLDDDLKKLGKRIHNIPIVGTIDQIEILKDRHAIDMLVIALPPSANRRIREVVEFATTNSLEVRIIPSFQELALGRLRASQVRPVDFEDLLGRMPVNLHSESINHLINDKTIVVTGAGGSIGSELCRQIIMRHPKRLVLIDQSEFHIFQIEQELIKAGCGILIIPIVADIKDLDRMRQIFTRYSPQIVFHAAAYKHVYIMERQSQEAIKNNSIATANLALLASELDIEEFVLISSDKAINPTNIMGASKRLAEIAIQSIQKKQGNKTKFMAVRFGNVLGSSGSVIPIFKQQIANGGPITVTHPDVTRYFMTIMEAARLVLQAATQVAGGDIFVLDMGNPIKIVDVARRLIELSGFKPDVDIEIVFTGLRPGEKLFEEIKSKDERNAETSPPSVFRFISDSPSWENSIASSIQVLEHSLSSSNNNDLKQIVKNLVPEYTPYLE
ncbi:MAG: hypothetical protein A2007_01755 [Verrucomicrobia bacterium GWC2_42_7]|nr:MAG: hypothetical protein A2007_01755 [Verrucomicrobia bacterium GWC2_42_7]